jgi:hypothetical protein
MRSFILAEKILAVVRKLEGVMESRFLRAVREIGFPFAERLGIIAQEWGNTAARIGRLTKTLLSTWQLCALINIYSLAADFRRQRF